MLDRSSYEEMRLRPRGNVAMAQSWRNLLFLHFSADPDTIQSLLPNGLTVDTFPDEAGTQRAWIGLVPFSMHSVRPRWMPRFGGVWSFAETNVRTYVHAGGKSPGVWFFSLDAANALACEYARRVYSLPYWHAAMSVSVAETHAEYRSKRDSNGATLAISAEIDEPIAPPVPGSLEFFLIERYALFASRPGGLATGRVFHRPYPLRSAKLQSCEETLVASAGIRGAHWEHICFSEGVDVDVFALANVD